MVDDDGKLVGILTEGDLLRRTELGTERERPKWFEFLRGPAAVAQRLCEDTRPTGRRSDDG